MTNEQKARANFVSTQIASAEAISAEFLGAEKFTIVAEDAKGSIHGYRVAMTAGEIRPALLGVMQGRLKGMRSRLARLVG
jgi:hypothetical protein